MMILSNRRPKNPKYRYLGNIQRKIQIACDKIIEEMRENPPNMLGWLRGGINVKRMNHLKKEIENGSTKKMG